MALNAPHVGSHVTNTAFGAHDFRTYNKMSRASRGFPKKIGLSMNRKLGIFIKEIGGALDEEDYEPEYELLEDIDMSEETSKPLPPELQPVLMDDGLPWGNSEDAIMDDDSDCDASDYQNTEDWDPGQDTTDYGPSSDEALEPCNAFGLGEASDLTLTPLPGHLNPKGDDGRALKRPHQIEPKSRG